MPSVTVRIAAASSLACVLAGCGSGSEALARETAMQHAMNAVANEVADPSSSVYRHHIELRTAVPYGKGGWLVRVADRTTGTPICVTDLPTEGAFGLRENLALRPCGPQAEPLPPDEPAPSSPPAA
jgi:hypothetical protein